MNAQTKSIFKGLLIGFAVTGGIGLAYYIFKKKDDDVNKNSSEEKEEEKETGRSIIIGDSQTPYIAKQSQKVDMLGKVGSEQNLWKGGQNLSWLKKAVTNYPVTKDVSNVVINIGTNGGFNKKDDIEGLVREVKRVFPKANLFATQGSWGWGYNDKITEEQVKSYYDKFRNLGVKVISPAIGKTEPHRDLPVYKEIGKNLDLQIKN